jgi:2-amino-4-hydroxy-6-hydroxymethyldihydropteridine diphosphokinase
MSRAAAAAAAAGVRPHRRRAEMVALGPWEPAYVALGANLGDPVAQVEAAIAALDRLPDSRLVARSRLYRTRPVGLLEQPDFINAAAALVTTVGAAAFHEALMTLERALGKVPPAQRNGPRRIDLDLLAFAEQTVDLPELRVPHPRLHERAFVLYPLAELAPDLWIPGHGRVAALRDAVGDLGIEPLSR